MSKRISVRLDVNAWHKVQEANRLGYKTSEYVNHVINGNQITDLDLARKIMIHVTQIQTEMELEQDHEIQKMLERNSKRYAKSYHHK